MPLSGEEEKQVIKNDVMEICRLAGFICYDMDEATSPELEEQIKGEG